LAASIADPLVFTSGREMAAWIGLVPRQNSTGGKQRLGKISKQGDQYLRWLLVAGAMTMIRHAKRRGAPHQPWLGNAADQGGGSGLGQQDGPDGLGPSKTWRRLSTANRHGELIRHQRGKADHQFGEVQVR
jgi:hypothetical protein